jgi:dTDP-4-amino-4,6-dideoxygalactose transaminase
MIQVTKTFLPDIKEYISYLEGIWQRGQLTSNGPLVNELEEKIRNYLGVKHFYFINNGTTALLIAIKAAGISGEVITTPFSYVATTSSIAWQSCKPVFADINSLDLTINPEEIRKKITPATSAILATHVYGFPCNVTEIDAIAKEFNLKVIYDAAHAFGVKLKNKSILNFGDLSVLSFHATKLFHTAEGGGIATNNDELAKKISYMRNFGHNGQEDYFGIGINGKSSELHAAMGLCVFPHIHNIIERRKLLCELYDNKLNKLNSGLQPFIKNNEVAYNYSYYPIIFETESNLIEVKMRLENEGIHCRRYFYPSLNTLNYVENNLESSISETISKRILCLPLFHDLTFSDVEKICSIILQLK